VCSNQLSYAAIESVYLKNCTFIIAPPIQRENMFEAFFRVFLDLA